jgi:hypothetical protein
VRQRGDRVTFAFPTNDDLFTVFVALPAAELPKIRADVEGQFMAVVARMPELDQRLRNGRRVERFYGATDLPNFLRKPYGPGWALVGDAGVSQGSLPGPRHLRRIPRRGVVGAGARSGIARTAPARNRAGRL